MSINGDKGSNYTFGNQLDVAQPSKSRFNLSYVNSFTAEEGKAYPCFYEYTVGGDTGTISQENLVRVLNTPTVPLASRQRMFVHTYISSLGSLWAEAETFFTKGRTISDSKSLNGKVVPTVSLSAKCFERGKLMDMLGFVNIPTSDPNKRFSVPIFKPMMYLRLMRDNYINQRIHATWLEWMSENKDDSDNVDYSFIKDWMYPADDHEFRWNSKVFDSWFNSSSDTVKNSTFDYLFGDLWYRYWTDDYFTTSQLTPIYGDVPTYSSTLEGTLNYLGNSSGFLAIQQHTVEHPEGTYSTLNSETVSLLSTVQQKGPGNAWDIDPSHRIFDGSNKNVIGRFSSSNAKSLKDFVVHAVSDMTLDSLRNLASSTAILQKLAHTDGSYSQYGLTYFGVKPKLAQDMKATYIGGSYQPIIFNEVVNTATSQGDISGRGISAGKDSIGTYFADDYGIIMSILSIMPDTYYSQGWHKQDLYSVSDDFYLPERSVLGMEAVLNQEIYYKPEGYVNPVFGYQQRFDYMRYRYNEVHGKVADPSNESYSPYIEQRSFSDCPTLTPSFLSMKGTIDAKWRTDKTDGVSYFVQILNSHMATRPLPYKAEPNNLGF